MVRSLYPRSAPGAREPFSLIPAPAAGQDANARFSGLRGFAAMIFAWEQRVKAPLKVQLKRRGLGYRELVEKLEALGIQETERNIANKISRGGFTAVFLVQCLSAIGCLTLRLESE
ncbi:MAG: DUF6471 domain-containing protein [Pseudolabrys sp.]